MVGKYQEKRFPDRKKYFDRQEITDQRPPVFLKSFSDHNVIVNPDLSADERKTLMDEIPIYERHRYSIRQLIFFLLVYLHMCQTS